MRLLPLLIGLFAFIPVAVEAAASDQDLLKQHELHPSLQMTVFARDPDVVDPVALCWDEQGRMFVVEMIDYPYGMGPEKKPGGRVRLLEDLDGDGKAERSTVFAENLSFPTSI